MDFSNPELLDAFYEMNKEKYPGLSKEQVKEIIYSPWIKARKDVADGLLPVFMFKYLGKFRVFPGRIKYALQQARERYVQGRLKDKYYFPMEQAMTKYLEDEGED